MNDHEQVAQDLLLDFTQADRASAESFEGFLQSVVIDCRPQPKRFIEAATDWQLELASLYADNLEFTAGVQASKPAGPNRFFYVLPRGSDKTTSIGRACNWALAYSRRGLRAVVAAADTEQAQLIHQAMEGEARLNPWLARRLSFDRRTVRGAKESELRILAADAAGSWGLLGVDLFILDELTWWKTAPGIGGNRFWDAISSAFHKRDAMVVIISNAGELETWQWKVFQEAEGNPGLWKTWSAPVGVNLATWMNPEARKADYRLLPPSVARRVFDNVWVDPSEAGGYLTKTEAQACEDKSLPLFGVQPIRGQNYWASVDYGPKRDRTVLSLGHLDETIGRVVVDVLDVWQGSPESPIQVSLVEDWIADKVDRFHCDIVLDPYQMEGVAQRFEHTRLVERFEGRGGKSNYELAECLRSLVVNRQLGWNPQAGRLVLPSGEAETFADELARLVTKPTSYGYRVDHTSGRHDDRAVAVGMLCLMILRDPTKGVWVAPKALGTTGQSPSHVKSPMEKFRLDLPQRRVGLYGFRPQDRRPTITR